jgi:hypothetical protein
MQLITLAKLNIQQHCCENLKSGTEHIILETFISSDKKMGSDLPVWAQWKELFSITGHTSSGDLRTETVQFLNSFFLFGILDDGQSRMQGHYE